MAFHHSMTIRTEGMRSLSPVKWRSMDGMIGAFWDMEAARGANGYYLSPDPRIVIFFNDVASHIRMCDSADMRPSDRRPMGRAIYVPPGRPMWTDFVEAHRFSHLDLHIHRDQLLRFLTPSLGRSAALAVMRRPAEASFSPDIEGLAGLLVRELAAPVRNPLYAESLGIALAARLLDLRDTATPRTHDRFGERELESLGDLVRANRERRLSVSEMAEAVGLSESRFAAVFRDATGQSPSQWQLGQRVSLAKELLRDRAIPMADIAAALGFCDQAHLTRSFRKVAGETPSAFRRAQRPVAATPRP